MDNKITNSKLKRLIEEVSNLNPTDFCNIMHNFTQDIINRLQADNKRITKEYLNIQNHYLHDTVAQYAENKGYLKALDDFEDRLSFIAFNNDKGKEYLEGFMDAMEIVDGFIRDLKASKVQTIKGDVQ